MLFHNKSSKISIKILILNSIQNIVKIDQVTPPIHIVSNLVNLNFPIPLRLIESGGRIDGDFKASRRVVCTALVLSYFSFLFLLLSFQEVKNIIICVSYFIFSFINKVKQLLFLHIRRTTKTNKSYLFQIVNNTYFSISYFIVKGNKQFLFSSFVLHSFK